MACASDLQDGGPLMTAHPPTCPALPGRLAPLLAALTLLSGLTLAPAAAPAPAEAHPGWLTSRPRPPAPAVRSLAVGDEVRTDARQCRRAVLPDGSVLYVNQNSDVRVTAERGLTLSRGEIFVEAA